MPSPDDRPELLRAHLTEQVDYLRLEVEALRTVIHRVPEPILSTRPIEGQRTLKEMYGLLTARDAQVHAPVLRQVAEGATDVQAAPPDAETLLGEEDWNALPMEALLDRLHTARTEVVRLLEALTPAQWEQTVTTDDKPEALYHFVHHITQHDAEVLRQATVRLHESNLRGGADEAS